MAHGARFCLAVVLLAGALLAGALLLWLTRRGERSVGAHRRRELNVSVKGRDLPLIFIGGVPNSGTTLMRAMLDPHPNIRCGQDTHVLPFILEMHHRWMKSYKERNRLEQAAVSKAVLNNALAAFCMELILRREDTVLHGAPRLCTKDPLLLNWGTYVVEIFPNAKFVFMVRDGRATVHSIISRKLTIPDIDTSSYRQSLIDWNRFVGPMYQECKAMGPDKCLMVRYEELVQRPRAVMQRVLDFLQMPWHDAVLHHELYVNQPNGVKLTISESRSNQVKRPVNVDALFKWVGHLPTDMLSDVAELAPMLLVLGYDPWANPPRYEFDTADAVTEYLPPQ